MRQNLVIVQKQRTMLKKTLNMVWFILTALMLIGSIWLSPVIFPIPAIVFGCIWYHQSYRSDVEYEYVYFDGDLRIAKVTDKRKRKSLVWVTMEDNIILIAPKGDRSVYKYENDKSVTYKNLGSGSPDAKVYELIVKGEKGMARYEFEPDEEMLDAMLTKYSRTVIK